MKATGGSSRAVKTFPPAGGRDCVLCGCADPKWRSIYGLRMFVHCTTFLDFPEKCSGSLGKFSKKFFFGVYTVCVEDLCAPVCGRHRTCCRRHCATSYASITLYAEMPQIPPSYIGKGVFITYFLHQRAHNMVTLIFNLY